LGQFFQQTDLGLEWLGELPLNPAFSGVTVLGARGTRWLRAYGLTTHPNQLGALLTALLLFLLPAWLTLIQTGDSRRRLLLYTTGIALGLAGLYVSFSRSAWLAFGGGLLVMGGMFVCKQPYTSFL